MKLRNKLILSCAALAAVATTAVSTTFAWYTSNTTVTATGVTAGTDAANSSTLQISKNGSTWGTTVDIDIDTGKFNPVAYGKGGNGTDGAATPAADTAFYTWNTTNNAVNATEASASTDYVQFTLYFRNLSGASDHVYLKTFELKNATTGDLPTTQTLVTDGLVAASKTRTDLPAYSVNLLRALDLKLDVVERTFSDDATYNVVSDDADAVATASTTTIYNLDAFHTSSTVAAANKKADSIDDTTNSLGASANAHTYYNAVKGSSIATTNPLATLETATLGTNFANANYSASAANASIDFGTAKGTTVVTSGVSADQDATYIKTTWTLFLNGWDTMCFDGVKGQKITLSMAFTTAF